MTMMTTMGDTQSTPTALGVRDGESREKSETLVKWIFDQRAAESDIIGVGLDISHITTSNIIASILIYKAAITHWLMRLLPKSSHLRVPL